MTRDEAYKIFEKYVQKEYSSVRLLSETETEERYLFEFCEKDDDLPIDYPVISVRKRDKKVEELSFTNTEQRKIIYGN